MSDPPPEGQRESIWVRLRHRKAVQWGVAYAAGAWGLQQGIAYVSSLLSWPAQLQKLSGLLLLVGLPIALTLAWYHGDKGQRRVTRAELAILTLLFLLGGGLFWRYQHMTRAPATTVPVEAPTAAAASPTAGAIPTDDSIAVLPFVNMSPDREQEYFADGISEELLNLLAQVPRLRVIARTSSFSFKGREVDIATIARTLNVANVLEGSVRKSGDTIRITAQLVRASDSSHLWSQTYDRKLTDVFAVQDEIAGAVVNELKIRLLGGAPKARATDPRAYELFLQARSMSRYDLKDMDRAVSLYQQSLAVDPNYAPAWAGLALVHFDQMDYPALRAERGLPLAREAVRRALASDPSYAPAYGIAALVESVIAGDVQAAARFVEKGMQLDPANSTVLESAVKVSRRLGRLEQSVALARYAVARDPLNVSGHENLGWALQFARRFDDSIEEFRAGIELDRNAGNLRWALGESLLFKGDARRATEELQAAPMAEFSRLTGLSWAYYMLGDRKQADAALQELTDKYAKSLPYSVAYVHAHRNEPDQAFEWLDKAIEYHDPTLTLASADPHLAPLHSDPRWLPLLFRLGQTPEQLAAIKFDVKVPN